MRSSRCVAGAYPVAPGSLRLAHEQSALGTVTSRVAEDWPCLAGPGEDPPNRHWQPFSRVDHFPENLRNKKTAPGDPIAETKPVGVRQVDEASFPRCSSSGETQRPGVVPTPGA